MTDSTPAPVGPAPVGPASVDPMPPGPASDPVVLPEGIGNADLDRLHEIVPPEAIAWVPETAAWYVIAALGLAGLAFLGWHWWRRWEANRFRRQALGELARIEADVDRPAAKSAALARLPELLKRTALASHPRVEVASLAGDEWADYLLTSVGDTEYAAADIRLLCELAYIPRERAAGLDDERVANLLRFSRQWIRRQWTQRGA